MTYPGGKNGSGVYQTIINQMPPHRIYIEAFLGGGAILRNKRPAPVANIGIDRDDDVVKTFRPRDIPKLALIRANALEWLALDIHYINESDTLLYLDPPYLMETRSSQRPIYRYELSEADHRQLLGTIKGLRCMVILSGYYSELYARELAGWRTLQYQAQCRNGKTATEWLWMNFPPPFNLHDYHYLGKNFRERERIKRKKTRWIGRLDRMKSLERYALLDAIQQFRDGDRTAETDNASVSLEMPMLASNDVDSDAPAYLVTTP